MIKKGKELGVQTYNCKDCNKYFSSKRRVKKDLKRELWIEYVFHKQTIRELSITHNLNKKTVYKELQSYKTKTKDIKPKKLRLLVDTLYFGSRKEKTTWCVCVFRHSDTKENLWWEFGETENLSLYLKGRRFLEEKGFTILSVTGDGLSLIRDAFEGIPFQMCLVHMERIIVRGTTLHPKLEAGRVLLALSKSIHIIGSSQFKEYMNLFTLKYFHFLNERSYNEITKERWYTHEELRKVFVSLQRLHPFLFTYENDSLIPKTTNSLEGHFAHIRDVLNIHRGASKLLKQKILHTILIANTISPKDEDLNEIV